MKINQLPLGARFEYEGEEYVKSGPLVATGKSGQRLIPKYAVLRPLDGAAPAPERRPSLPRDEVMAALAAFVDECAQLVPAEGREALAAARERFVQALR